MGAKGKLSLDAVYTGIEEYKPNTVLKTGDAAVNRDPWRLALI